MSAEHHLSGAYFLDVAACGAVQIRKRGQSAKGLLPVFSVDTEEEARSLQVLHCRLERDGSGIYRLNNPPQSVEDLPGITDMFRASHARLMANAKARQ